MSYLVSQTPLLSLRLSCPAGELPVIRRCPPHPGSTGSQAMMPHSRSMVRFRDRVPRSESGLEDLGIRALVRPVCAGRSFFFRICGGGDILIYSSDVHIWARPSAKEEQNAPARTAAASPIPLATALRSRRSRHLVPSSCAPPSTLPTPPRPCPAPPRPAGSRPDRTRQLTPGARRCAAAEGTQPAAQPDLRVDHPVSKF